MVKAVKPNKESAKGWKPAVASLLRQAEEAYQAGDMFTGHALDEKVFTIQAEDLQRLEDALQQLPKKRAQTAMLGWSDIVIEATEYAAAVSDLPKKDPAPWEVEAELKAIAACARALQDRLLRISRSALAVVENEAYTPQGKEADPWPWFSIGRYSFDSDGVPEPEEPWGGHDDMRTYELGVLAPFLESAASIVAKRKSAPRGERTPTQAQRVKDKAKRMLISTLHFELHTVLDRPVTHVLPIAQVIHTWATGESVKDEWGQTEIDRTNERIRAVGRE